MRAQQAQQQAQQQAHTACRHCSKCLANSARNSLPPKHSGLAFLVGAAGGGVAWGPNVVAGQPVQAETRREVLFDHYHQHTGGWEGLSVLVASSSQSWSGLEDPRRALAQQGACILLKRAVTPTLPFPLQSTAPTAKRRCAGCAPPAPACWARQAPPSWGLPMPGGAAQRQRHPSAWPCWRGWAPAWRCAPRWQGWSSSSSTQTGTTRTTEG